MRLTLDLTSAQFRVLQKALVIAEEHYVSIGKPLLPEEAVSLRVTRNLIAKVEQAAENGTYRRLHA